MRIMRYLEAVLGTLVLAACSTGPATRNESKTASPTQAPVAEPQKESIDSIEQFLVTSAVTDFQTHTRSGSVRVRDVRLGHITTSSGVAQYILCGEFLSEQPEGGKAEWMPFATVKTSGYEQWNGGQAEVFCKRSSITWDKGDLSSALQSRLDALR